jgi:hypothetical protein
VCFVVLFLLNCEEMTWVNVELKTRAEREQFGAFEN